MEIGKLTLTYPEKKTLIVESFDSKNNGVANYTCKDNQGNKYKVHLSENPFEAGTMLINIDNAKTGKPLWSYVIVYK